MYLGVRRTQNIAPKPPRRHKPDTGGRFNTAMLNVERNLTCSPDSKPPPPSPCLLQPLRAARWQSQVSLRRQRPMPPQVPLPARLAPAIPPRNSPVSTNGSIEIP